MPRLFLLAYLGDTVRRAAVDEAGGLRAVGLVRGHNLGGDRRNSAAAAASSDGSSGARGESSDRSDRETHCDCLLGI